MCRSGRNTMKRTWIVACAAGPAVGLSASRALALSPLGTTFTYQGQLNQGDASVDDTSESRH